MLFSLPHASLYRSGSLQCLALKLWGYWWCFPVEVPAGFIWRQRSLWTLITVIDLLSISLFLLLSPCFPFIFFYSSFPSSPPPLPSYTTSFILLLLSAPFFPLLLTPVSSVFIIFTPSLLSSSFFCFNTLLLSSPLFPSFPLWSSSFLLFDISRSSSQSPLFFVFTILQRIGADWTI